MAYELKNDVYAFPHSSVKCLWWIKGYASLSSSSSCLLSSEIDGWMIMITDEW